MSQNKPTLFPAEIVNHTSVQLWHKFPKKSSLLYLVVLIALIIPIVISPLLKIEVTSQSRGFVRSTVDNNVPQQLDLFAGNLIENIAVGELEPDMQRIVDICNTLGLLAFIESLPAGFSTWLGENGAQLSGGQKQRIAIARALYRDPEILILDEATSSLDSESEHYVQQAIFNMRDQGKTILLIAHRLSTVVMADKIVVMKQGNIIEEGTHEYLYNKRGVYYQMWQKQIPQHFVEPIETLT